MIEHKTVSLADQVFEHLETDILSGKYQRGEILTEAKLCQEFGISRTPVREALRRLEQEHIIEESTKGSVVIGISERDLDDIFLIRECVEALATEVAAKSRTAEQLNALKEALELQEFYLSKMHSEQIKIMDNRFHELIYTACGGIIFYDTLEPLHKKIQKYRKAAVNNKIRATASVEEHKKIFGAIADQNSEAARKYAIEHIKNAHNRILGKE